MDRFEMDEDAHDEILEQLEEIADEMEELDFSERFYEPHGESKFYESLEECVDNALAAEARKLDEQNLEAELDEAVADLEGKPFDFFQVFGMMPKKGEK